MEGGGLNSHTADGDRVEDGVGGHRAGTSNFDANIQQPGRRFLTTSLEGDSPARVLAGKAQ